MKSFLSLLPVMAVLLLTGCAALPDHPALTETGDWHAYAGTCPIEWRAIKSQQSYPDNPDWFSPQIHNHVEIRNTSTQKLQVVGVVSTDPNQGFVDLEQPGAFQVSLYPGQSSVVGSSFNSDTPKHAIEPFDVVQRRFYADHLPLYLKVKAFTYGG